jgi:predicted ester cyclase
VGVTDVVAEVYRRFDEGDLDGMAVATEHTGRGTHTGPFPTHEGEIPPTGRSVEVRFGEFFQLRDGKICLMRAYWDSATFFRQLGVT